MLHRVAHSGFHREVPHQMDKSAFTARIVSVQPRILLTRSFDESSHTYLGYEIFLHGTIDNQERKFSVGIGKAAHEKHRFRVGDEISGACEPVADERREPVEFYKVSKLKKIREAGASSTEPPPWEDVCPDLEAYHQRGHRRLAARTYTAKCSTCMWGCRMPVEIIIDHWDRYGKRKYRFEAFCYGPLNCKLYKAGPNRKVEGRKGMVWVEEDWVDEQNVEHREADE